MSDLRELRGFILAAGLDKDLVGASGGASSCNVVLEFPSFVQKIGERAISARPNM